MDSIYTLRSVKKSYDSRCVLDLDALQIQAGEILAVVGPSGAGKSTLLRLLNFLEYTDSGEICYKNQPVTPGLSLPIRRQVTTVFQRPALLGDSVEVNVAVGLRLRGVKDGHSEVDEAIRRMGLDALRKAKARTLSGGEMQRVALARALVIHPDVLLLDEPTANLDPYNISLIEDVVRETNQSRKTTVVLVTHNVFQAKRLATRVALLLNGQLVEISPTQTFFEDPADRRTRAFVGGEMVY